MTVERKIITEYEESGYKVKITLCQPCLLVYVDGNELSPFYANIAAARQGATAEIKRLKEAKEKRK